MHDLLCSCMRMSVYKLRFICPLLMPKLSDTNAHTHTLFSKCSSVVMSLYCNTGMVSDIMHKSHSFVFVRVCSTVQRNIDVRRYVDHSCLCLLCLHARLCVCLCV